MRIYVDFDDVLCETAPALSGLARELFGRDVPFERIRDFDLRKAFALERAQYEALMARAHEPGFLLAFPAMPGGVDCLRAWQGRGHEVVIVTGRPSSTHGASRAWLQRHGLAALPVLYVDKYNRNHDTPPDAPPMLPFDALRREPFDVAIDDSPVALDALRARPAGRTLVFDRPWNRAYDCSGARTTRCRGWDEVAKAVR